MGEAEHKNKPYEVKQTPKDVLTQLTERIEDLPKTTIEKAANLFWKIKEELTMAGVKSLLKWETSSNGDI